MHPTTVHRPIPQHAQPKNVTIGILALQGAFVEHEAMLRKLSLKAHTLKVLQVRTPDELARCDALIIPGGESTTIALLARISGLLEPLRDFVRERPVWGTCAGAILLAETVTGGKKGGQELLGGVGIQVERNGWGSQIESFEAPLSCEHIRDATRSFTGVFIRAPVIISISSAASPPIQVLARVPTDHLPPCKGADNDVAALRQGSRLVTTFHPELTHDARFHEYFVRECVLPALKDRAAQVITRPEV